MSNMWEYHQCEKCGKMILSKSDNIKCNCVNLHRSAQFLVSDPDSYYIERDPLSFYDGGFRKGTPITKIQAECMCDVGTFSDGTVLIDKHNTKFQVLRMFDGKQSLIRI